MENTESAERSGGNVMTQPNSIEKYRSNKPTHGGYGMPRGPITDISEIDYPTVAIGFCPQCGSNARETCSIRGMFDCPSCAFFWFDPRVGKQPDPKSIDEFMA